jgi:hypothetical protein
MIVDTKAEGAIGFFDKENRRAKGRLGLMDETLSDHIINILL